MTKDEQKQCILRFLLLYPISPKEGYNIADLFSFLSSVILEFNNQTFKDDLHLLLYDLLSDGFVELKEVRLGYATVDTTANIYYALTTAGINAANNIKNETIKNLILPTRVKDNILLNYCLQNFPPYLKFNSKSLQYIIKSTLLDLPVHEQVRISDNRSLHRVFNFLDTFGFIEQIDEVRFEFNERGKSLISISSYEKFIDWEQSELDKAQRRQDLSDRLLESNLSTGEIQKSLKSANMWIAGATVVAAVFYITQLVDYFSGLIQKKLPLYFALYVTVYLLLLGGLIGASLTLAILQMRKSIKRKNPVHK
ncbi:MAG: hypothetical protein P4L41_12185 [Flavipsychrobacter sp.]|nr:hypothetical protein [Flavipsychrobacter sp.]